MTAIQKYVERERRRTIRRWAIRALAIVVVAYAAALATKLLTPALDLRLALAAAGAVAAGWAIATIVTTVDLVNDRSLALDRLAAVRRGRTAHDDAPDGFERATNTVTSARRTAAGRDRWLRPAVADIVDARLGASVLGADPTRRPTLDLARHLSPATQQLIEPRADAPHGAADRSGAGMTAAELEQLLDELEQL